MITNCLLNFPECADFVRGPREEGSEDPFISDPLVTESLPSGKEEYDRKKPHLQQGAEQPRWTSGNAEPLGASSSRTSGKPIILVNLFGRQCQVHWPEIFLQRYHFTLRMGICLALSVQNERVWV